MVRVTCYGQSKEYETGLNAIAKYRAADLASEGSEQARYSRILMGLMFTSDEEIDDEE